MAKKHAGRVSRGPHAGDLAGGSPKVQLLFSTRNWTIGICCRLTGTSLLSSWGLAQQHSRLGSRRLAREAPPPATGKHAKTASHPGPDPFRPPQGGVVSSPYN